VRQPDSVTETAFGEIRFGILARGASQLKPHPQREAEDVKEAARSVGTCRRSSHFRAVSKRERDRRHDAKRRKEQPWRKLYKTPQWEAIRQAQLTAHPLCKWCLERGIVRRAEVVHHVERHNGDPVKFFAGPFESLCKQCHDSEAQSDERRGYSLAIGADGWPLDPRHPANTTHD